MHLRAVLPGAHTPGPAREHNAEPTQLPAPPAVLRAVATIRERYAEHPTLDQLASDAHVSPFDFCRVFAGATGLTPGRFLTAVRLFEAKRLLLTASLSIADIASTVGYPSVGAFTSRFAEAVGLTPSQYRDPAVGEMLVAVAPRLTRMPPVPYLNQVGRGCGVSRGSGSVTVRISLPRTASTANVMVGLFADPVPQSSPVVFAGLPEACGGARVTLPGVPPGRWYLMAVAQHGNEQDSPAPLSVGIRFAPISMSPHGRAIARLALRGPRATDAPVAFTLASSTTLTRHHAARPTELTA